MDFLHLIVLAAVQGITEFLPISSSAHLILVPHVLGWEDQGMIFDLSLHLGSLIAVFVYFRRDVLNLFRGLFALIAGRYRDTHAALLVNLAVATIPVGVAGLLVMDVIKTQGRDVLVIAFTSIVFGFLLWYADKLARRRGAETMHTVDDVSLPAAFMWGVYQAVALVPGVSRSGICVIGGRALGASRELAAKFGSLMSIPVTLLAVLASFGDADATLNWHTAFQTMLLGTVVSFACAMAAIHLLMTWNARIGYMPYVVYRMVLGFGLLAWFAMRAV